MPYDWVDKMEIDINMGVDPEIVREFEGKWVYMRVEGQQRVLLALLKKAGSRSALFITPTKQKQFVELYENIMGIATHSGTITLPDGIKQVVNGIVIEDPDIKMKNGV